jgi:hypothetical protein
MEEKKKELNLVEILKDCPKGTKLWSPICGLAEIKALNEQNEYPITIIPVTEDGYQYVGHEVYLMDDGRFEDYEHAECMLFPNKDNRDWSTFKAPKPKWNPDTLKPFDKVIVRDDEGYKWRGDFFLCKDEAMPDFPYTCIRTMYKYCIPYNEETKHLLGTNEEAPEYYRL